MSEAHSKASKLRQSLIPPEIRHARSVAAAKSRWKNKTPEERRLHALKMVEARQFGKLKKNDKNSN